MRYTICDTMETPDYSSYLEYCEANEFEPQGENSNDYWDFVSDCRTMEIEDMRDNMKYSKQCNEPVLITGSLGLWNGSPSIYPTRCETLYEAIQRCFGSCDDLKVEYENGVVYVKAYHHDGTNCFEIHKLSKKGIDATDSWFGATKDTEVKGYWLAKFHGYLY